MTPLVSVVHSQDASPQLLEAVRRMLADAFDEFDDDDWVHTLGGHHVLMRDPGVVSHAAVIPRRIEVDGRPFRTGYVEGVATAPTRQGEGLGTAVMRRVNELIRTHFELGALSTNRHTFYERLGWRRWRGPTLVRSGDDLRRNPEDDEGVMVLICESSEDLDIETPIACEARRGDDW